MGKRKRNGSDTTAAAATGSPMDVNLLDQIVRLMTANDLTTVDVRDGDRRVILKRGGEAVAPVVVAAAPAAAVSAASARAADGAAAPAGNGEEAGLTPVVSPMVGTFYSAATPDGKPFVSVGSAVDEETDVCIIEAMKVFNNIKAECRGTIAKVLIGNGQTVEFGQTLFLVRPD